jgi:DNA-binding response OmpR family regulator
MAKLLIVDDDIGLTTSLSQYLVGHGHTLEVAGTGEDAAQLLQSFGYDLIILDWTLPGINGDQVCRDFRQAGGKTPIIFLTGKHDIDSLEAALEYGADDYIVKPFNVRELYARIKNLLRPRTAIYASKLQIGDLSLDPEKCIVTVNTQTVKLRAKEAALLEYLMRNPDRVFSSQQLFDAVWPSDSDGSADVIRSWMNYLRQKLARLERAHVIKTILGTGYTIESGTVPGDQ